MKKIIYLTLLTISTFLLLSSKSVTNKEIDERLVGIWKGFEINQENEGVEKHWIQQRLSNGTYYIMFTVKQDCEVNTFTESGKWWTKDGKFYEQVKSGKNIDVYDYELENPIVVKFKSIELNGRKDNSYIFSDYKIDLD